MKKPSISTCRFHHFCLAFAGISATRGGFLLGNILCNLLVCTKCMKYIKYMKAKGAFIPATSKAKTAKKFFFYHFVCLAYSTYGIFIIARKYLCMEI